MKPYTKLYIDFFGYKKGDVIPCEVTGSPAVDISHNEGRGMGGRLSVNVIENLMALTREAHTFLEDNPRYRWWYDEIHRGFMRNQVPYAANPDSREDPIFQELVGYIAEKQ